MYIKKTATILFWRWCFFLTGELRMNKDIYYDYVHNVLKNKLNIKNSKDLEKEEYKLTGYRMAQLREEKSKSALTMDDFKKIHYHLFQDVYEWAGQYREVNLQKGNTSFLPYQFFHHAEKQIDHDINRFLKSPNNSKKFVCKQLGKMLIEINYMHPFRDGNAPIRPQLKTA